MQFSMRVSTISTNVHGRSPVSGEMLAVDCTIVHVGHTPAMMRLLKTIYALISEGALNF